MITLSALAKINLTLEVLGRRDDGYHEIASILQTIALADELSLEPAAAMEVVCTDPAVDRPDLITEPILRAAELLRERTGCAQGARIRFERMGIPRGAGLGSSSAAPAAVLRGLRDLWKLTLSESELEEMAASLGSDTPFFIRGGTAVAGGRGERITPLKPLPTVWLVIIVPTIESVLQKTARLYRALTRAHYASGAATARLARELRAGRPLRAEFLYNTFEEIAFDFFSGLEAYREKFLAAGAPSVHLAGSGPALFALVGDISEGELLYRRLRDMGLRVYLTHTV